MGTRDQQEVAEELWLHYFNDYLFQKKAISENEHTKMKRAIRMSMRSSFENQ